MNFMLSGLLKDLVGAKRAFHVNEFVDMADSGLELAEPVEGEVHMTRTARGVLVVAHLHTLLRQVCGRCVETVLSPVDLDIEEEFLQTLDVGTGQPLDLGNLDQEDPAILIDGHHVVDLDNIIRQYLLAWAPISPLCRDDCAGLCFQCGANLNEGRCSCPPPVVDSRLAGLASLIEPGK
jgi:uncharacterized protein